jgi:hypothetical protein
MANQIGQLASGIVQWDFDYITGVEAATEVQKVSGWLLTNLGQLNTLIYTTFYSGTLNLETGYATGNHLQQEEKAIYTQVYLQDYYNKQARLSLRSFVNTSTSSTSSVEMTPWTTLREGDTTIQRDAIKVTASARTEASRTFKNLAAAAEAKLQDLVYRYNYYQGAPRQVAGSDGN